MTLLHQDDNHINEVSIAFVVLQLSNVSLLSRWMMAPDHATTNEQKSDAGHVQTNNLFILNKVRALESARTHF